jgi:transposase
MVSIDLCLDIKIKGSRTFDNTAAGQKALLAWVHKKKKDQSVPVTICMEATGNHYESLAYMLHEKGEHVSVVLANKARRYMQSLGLKSKNDKIDANGLAQMGAQQKLDRWNPISKLCYDLKKLTRQREHLQEHITLIKNQ